MFVEWIYFILIYLIYSNNCHPTLRRNMNVTHQNSPKFNSSSTLSLSPVILVPGLGGTQLHAKLEKPSAPHFWCRRKIDYFKIWLNVLEMMPFVIDCWVDNMRLMYNNVTRKTHNSPGVEIKLPKFGQTEQIEWIDKTPILDFFKFGAYFHYIVEALLKIGYVREKTLFGAPYDFRKGPNENEEWFSQLINLTEYAYMNSKNVKVTFVCHSMGGKMLLNFLQRKPKEWKDKYVKRVIALSVPWGGTMRAMEAILVGYDLGIKIINSRKMKELQKTYPSVVWLLPSKDFWKSDDVLVTINGNNFTLDNIDQFLYTIGNTNAIEMKKDLSLYNSFDAPGVEMHCLFGSIRNSVIESLNFVGNSQLDPISVKGDGDGTINRRSLIGCQRWKTTNGHSTIYQEEYPNVEHYDIVSDSRIIDYIVKTLQGLNGSFRSSKTNINNKKIMGIRIF